MAEPLDPVSFFVSLGTGEVAASVLAWVAVAVSAAVSLVLVVVGIKKGLGFFMGLLEERGPALEAVKSEKDLYYDAAEYFFDATTRNGDATDWDDFDRWFAGGARRDEWGNPINEHGYVIGSPADRRGDL